MSRESAGQGGAGDMLVSDAERDSAVERLQAHCQVGRLTLEELSERVGLALRARKAAELERALAGLPELALGGEAAFAGEAGIATQRAGAATPAAPRAPARRVTRWAVAIMGGSDHRGRFRLSGQMNALSLMGGVTIDLRNAEIEGAEVVINALVVMGGVDVIVPEGIDVDLTGIPIMGGKELRLADVPVIPGSPLVRVRALCLMGGVTVRSKPARARGSAGAGSAGEVTDGMQPAAEDAVGPGAAAGLPYGERWLGSRHRDCRREERREDYRRDWREERRERRWR